MVAASTPDPTGAIEKMCIEDGIFSDWTIVSEEGQRFPCHRIILAAKSSTMKFMMTTEMREKAEKETVLKYNSQVVEAFVDYFYKGKVPPEVLGSNLSSFLNLADLYDLKPLKAQTEDAAITRLTMENVVEMFSLASLHNAKKLKKASMQAIMKIRFCLENQNLKSQTSLLGKSRA